nr:integrase, catalytic region, zinc finger, CCHC-type, peptidase aspartic, catalytic [Tanacetum cinerariifolium]
MGMFVGAGEGGRDKGELCVSGGVGWKVGRVGLWSLAGKTFLGTVRFGNNDFAVIAGYRDVVIGSMTIKKVYYVEGLGHNLFSVGQFYDKGLEVAFRKSTCFVRNEDGVDLLTGNRSSNLYTIALNKVASNSSSCLLAKAFSLQSWLWHQRLSHLNFATINNLVKNNLVQVSKVYEASKNDLEDLFQDFYNEYFDSSKIMQSSTMNVETLITKKVFHEVSESFQGESSSSSLNDDIQQSPEEVILPSSNTQLIPINMVPNGDEASTSYNVFNERLEDAYFDASTSFHDPSNVHTYYQPYPHEKKWTKDHPLHKIIGDPKSSVRTREHLANSCLFSCLLSSIEPANVAEALRNADWGSAMQEELDQFARLKTTFLNGILNEEVYVGQPPGFVNKQYTYHVYALDKVLYGLKQAPRACIEDHWWPMKLCGQVRIGCGSSLWCRGFHGEKERDVAILKTNRGNCGSRKQLVGEGGMDTAKITRKEPNTGQERKEDVIYGMESMTDQMAEIIGWGFRSRKKHTPKR